MSTALAKDVLVNAQQALAKLSARPDDTQLQKLHQETGIPLNALQAARTARFEKGIDAAFDKAHVSRNLRLALNQNTAPTFNAVKTGGLNAYALSMNGGLVKDKPQLEAGIAAVKGGDVRALQRWIKAGGDAGARDTNGLTPLDHAAALNKPEAVDLLMTALKGRTDVLLPDRTTNLPSPLHLAARGNAVDAARVLLKGEPKLLNHVWGLNGHTPLLEATFNDNVEMARWLLGRPGVDTTGTRKV